MDRDQILIWEAYDVPLVKAAHLIRNAYHSDHKEAIPEIIEFIDPSDYEKLMHNIQKVDPDMFVDIISQLRPGEVSSDSHSNVPVDLNPGVIRDFMDLLKNMSTEPTTGQDPDTERIFKLLNVRHDYESFKSVSGIVNRLDGNKYTKITPLSWSITYKDKTATVVFSAQDQHIICTVTHTFTADNSTSTQSFNLSSSGHDGRRGINTLLNKLHQIIFGEFG